MRPARLARTVSPCILFRVAAGPRIGSGHLVRACRLANLATVPSHVSVRGDRAVALRLPSNVRWHAGRSAGETLDAVRPTLLVVDDPAAWAGRAWVAAARRRGVPVAAIVDGGIGAREADLEIDGSVVARPADPRGRSLRGPAFAVTDPAVSSRRRLAAATRPATIFISLGGGYRTRYAQGLARELRRAGCRAPIVIAGGFTRVAAMSNDDINWLGPKPTLVPWLSSATVAVVAGGITMYESCALGTPTVAVTLVTGQRRAVTAMAQLGGVCRVPHGARVPPEARRVAACVVRLLRASSERHRLARRGRAIVDGDGARRVARILRRLASGHGVEWVRRANGKEPSVDEHAG